MIRIMKNRKAKASQIQEILFTVWYGEVGAYAQNMPPAQPHAPSQTHVERLFNFPNLWTHTITLFRDHSLNVVILRTLGCLYQMSIDIGNKSSSPVYKAKKTHARSSVIQVPPCQWTNKSFFKKLMKLSSPVFKETGLPRCQHENRDYYKIKAPIRRPKLANSSC